MRKILKDIVSFIKYLLSFILKFKNISILMYHTVDHSNDFKNVIVKNFNKQLKFLKENKYHVIKLNTLLEKDYKNKIENSKNVIITFDDGDESLYINVFPILKKYQIPVTIFLISGFIGKKNYLNNNQIIEMFNSGLVDFGAHTVNHKKLHLLSKKELSYEIKQSKKDIDNILGINILSFAYPKGRFNSLVVNRVKKYNFKIALTVLEGYVNEKSDLLRLPRLSIDKSTSWFQFLGKISGLQFIKHRI